MPNKRVDLLCFLLLVAAFIVGSLLWHFDVQFINTGLLQQSAAMVLMLAPMTTTTTTTSLVIFVIEPIETSPEYHMSHEASIERSSDYHMAATATAAQSKFSDVDQNIQVTFRENLLPSRFAVFTSAGDHANIAQWLPNASQQRIFHLIVVYYGTKEQDVYSDVADIYARRKDAKYPNLQFMMYRVSNYFQLYEAVWVTDDDIRIDHGRISRLFQLRRKHKIRVLQPAFARGGRSSHWVTKQQTKHLTTKPIRYTNFVEMTCPMFDIWALKRFMDEFDPDVKGWGTDFLFLASLRNVGQEIDSHGEFLRGKVAVIDSVPCVNPNTATKHDRREITKLQSTQTRIEHFTKSLLRHNTTVWSCYSDEEKPVERCLKSLAEGVSSVDNECFAKDPKACHWRFIDFYAVAE